MFIRICNDSSVDYPFDILRLPYIFPNKSFPDRLTKSVLAEFGVYAVEALQKPEVDQSKNKVVEQTPELVNGEWRQVWEVVPLTNDDHSLKAKDVRANRNKRLAETDWRFRSDMTPSQEWKDYCQALRDITSQTGFPWTVTWPEQP